MAKQRRAPKKAISRKKKRIAARVPGRAPAQPAQEPAAQPAASPPRLEAAPSPREVDHQDAVNVYERGLKSLQQRNYQRAAEIFRSVLESYPEEKELHERVRLYLNVCERATTPVDSTPKNFDERVYAATLAMNTGAYRDALSHLQAALRERPDHDHAHYMLAAVYTSLRSFPEALSQLQRAIELNPDNRTQAAQDPDFDALRDHTRFRALVGVARRLMPR
ncbi:MAG: tetratricopeptide repeat protein [Acidobacteria bacterium]|nr:MAG: tetratricopeptide repeat protein [Acidobacteriota bacterium]